MNILAIDTSGGHLTALIFKGDEVFCSFSQDVGLKHSVSLMPEVELLLEKSGVSLSEIDVFAAVTGPGSFTGIRIGVSTVKAFAYAHQKKVLPVTSFETLAYNVNDKLKLAVIDAKHNNYYVCGFDGNNVVLKPSFITLTELEELAKIYTVVASQEIPVNYVNVDLKDGLIAAVKQNAHLATEDKEQLVPLYVKKSQAEEESKC